MDNHSGVVSKAALVIACDLTTKEAVQLGLLMDHANIPLVLLRQYGMLGYMRVYKHECAILEAKEFAVNTRDLRLATPWPELQAFCD